MTLVPHGAMAGCRTTISAQQIFEGLHG